MVSSPVGAAPTSPEPRRTCVGCRRQDSRNALLRVVAVQGRLVPDPARRMPGRGASVHPDPQCLALAVRRRAWERALRTAPLDPSDVEAWVGDHQDLRSAPAGRWNESTKSSGADGNEHPMNAQP